MDIIENIRYWSSLVGLNESSSILLDNLAKVFGRDIVFSIKNVSLDDSLLNALFDELNANLFQSKLIEIPIVSARSDVAKKIMADRGSEIPPDDFLGVYSAMLFNDDKITRDSEIEIGDDMILINRSNVDNRSFVFIAATLCHEMIHFYDRLFGEYAEEVRCEVLCGKPVDSHEDPTFRHFMKLANEEKLNVIKHMHTSDIDMLDYEAMEKMISSIYEGEEISTDYDNDKVKYYFEHIHLPKVGKNTRSINHYD